MNNTSQPKHFRFSRNDIKISTSNDNKRLKTSHFTSTSPIKAGISPNYIFTPFTNSPFRQTVQTALYNSNSPVPFFTPSTTPQSTFLKPFPSLRRPKAMEKHNHLRLMTTMLKLVDRKKSLVSYLEQMNHVADKLKEHNQVINTDFQQRYAWVMVQLKKTSQSLNEGLEQLKLQREEMEQLLMASTTPKTPTLSYQY